MAVGGKDADTDDCMDVEDRATQDAKAELTRMYLQRVMSTGLLSHSITGYSTNQSSFIASE